MRKAAALLFLFVTPILANSIEQARELIAESEYDKAVPLLEAALDDEAARLEALTLLAGIYNTAADYKKGTNYAKQAVEMAPDDSNAHLMYARALAVKMQNISKFRATFILGSYKKELRTALELEPENIDARMEQIGFFIHAPGIAGGSMTRAQELIEELKPLSWRDAMYMQAEMYEKQEDPTMAAPTYAEIVERDAEDLEARQSLAFALQAAGKYHEADEHFMMLLEVDDPHRSLQSQYQLARSRILGEYEQEKAVEFLLAYIEGLSEAAQGLPSESNAYWRLGLAYRQLDRMDEARKALERSIALDGGNQNAKDALKGL